MKIVRTSNFNDERYNESLVAETIVAEELGKVMVDALNAKIDNNSSHYYELVKDDYKLYKFEP